MMRLQEFRTTAQGLPDLLRWSGLFGKDVVGTKDGGLMAAWEYSGPDLDSATPAELSNMAARLNSALGLGDGWVLHCDALRAPAPGYPGQGAFFDRTTALIDQVRRARYMAEGLHFTSRFVLSATWFPMPDAANKVTDRLVEGGEKANTETQNLRRFQNAVREIEGRLSGLVRIRRLGSTVDEFGHLDSELLAYLESSVTMQHRPMRLASVPMYLDSVLGHHDFATGFSPRVGNRYIAAVAITGFPGNSFPGILDFLNRLPVAYRWSNRFIYLDPNQAEKVLNKYRSKWSQKRKSMTNLLRENAGGQATHINVDADRMANQAIQAIAEASSGLVRYGYYSSVILLSDENEALLAEVAREVVKLIQNQGFGARIETVNAVEAYLGAMPGNTIANVRRPLIHTLNLAHLLPFTSVWAGPERNPCPFYPPDSPPLLYANTDGSTPFRVCLHDGDLGHTFIGGPTGAGKSTLLAMLVAQQFRYPRAQVFVFDKGYSMLPLCWAAGGQHYDISGEHGDLAFCPLGRVDDRNEQLWAAEWLETLVALQFGAREVTPLHRKELLRAVRQLGESTTEPAQRTMTNFLMLVQDTDLRDALLPYTLSGMAGTLLDAETDGLGADPFQVFEMEHIMAKGEKLLLPVLTYIFHRLEQRFTGAPTLLVLDEAWIMLGHPIFKEKIREWFKVLRKANVAVVPATQSLTDIVRSGIADVIFESCPTKILLPNAEADTENIRPLYEAVGLNRRQIEIISRATPKRHYYMLSPQGRRLFELGLGPVELAFAGASGKDDIAQIRELRATYGEQWPAEWLRHCGQWEAADTWESFV